MVFFSVFFFSCTDFFSDSLGKWAARNKSRLIPKVTVGNVDELISMAENDPDLSLEILRKILEEGGKISPEDYARLQAAALEAAANATGGANAILEGLGSLSTIDMDSVEQIILDTLNSMPNLEEASRLLSEILPVPADPQNPEDDETFMAFANNASSEDLALAAILLLAGEVLRTDADDFESVMDNISESDSVKQAQAMAIVSVLSEREDAVTGPLRDALEGLGLIKKV